MAGAIAFLVLLLVSPTVTSAATIPVGGSGGWTLTTNYANWASSQTFSPGDFLVFNYDPSSHSVMEVSQSDYNNCNSNNPINSYTTSPSTVPLSAPGTRYFICPTTGHCSAGMSVAVTVTRGSSGSTPTTPAGSPATPGTTTPPSAPAANAASTYGGWTGFASATSLVLAAVLALMI